MNAILTKLFHFEAAHQLTHHKGKCARLHGHSYKLEVSICGPIKPERGASDDGMVLDLDDLKTIVREVIIKRVDHCNLNELMPMPTTAENIIHWIWGEFERAEPSFAALLYRLRLWETASGYVEITRTEREAL